MTQAISSLGVEWCDRWNDGRSSRVAWVFKLIIETEPSVYLWAYILNCCMFYELEQPAETEEHLFYLEGSRIETLIIPTY
ncbi:hypothetical protein LOK49_LG12G00321 [Camellia lanceoleosa]|uniref:Uncharacterized protein n=1 Tax=Camellia lanceoleosa TaxID=1840588 RepID=A0ACC0FPI4_9ERIC|nr:hypothetical protein LOK49_LG12G00321 [Camellia lanceoleosa]